MLSNVGEPELISSSDAELSLLHYLVGQCSRLGSTFVDGGVHPRFGTRNFTLPLQNGQYIEVVCPLDHPATEQTPWGKAIAAIEKITIADKDQLAESWFKEEILTALGETTIEWVDPSVNDGDNGIVQFI
jgi:hypothetical protein